MAWSDATYWLYDVSHVARFNSSAAPAIGELPDEVQVLLGFYGGLNWPCGGVTEMVYQYIGQIDR